jgi:hypothetical protein
VTIEQYDNGLSNLVIGAAIEVHKTLGQVSWNPHTNTVSHTNWVCERSDFASRCPYRSNTRALDWNVVTAPT